MEANRGGTVGGKGQYVYGRCEFCASKGYEKRKLIQSPAGLRCASCMNVVESLDDAIVKMTAPNKA